MTAARLSLCSLVVVVLASTATQGFAPPLAQHHHHHQKVTTRLGASSRRDVLLDTPAKALVATILGSSVLFPEDSVAVASEQQQQQSKTIVLTGANSGIGLEATKLLAAAGAGHTLILACRTMAKAEETKQAIVDSGIGSSSNAKIIPAECDLASLESISKFVATAGNYNKIDTLCCNAGLARNTAAKDCARTKDGFELTVGTNHFGHFYLTNSLLRNNLINKGGGSGSGGNIVVTASGVHDPASPGGAQGTPAGLGSLAGLEEQGRGCEMIDGSSPFNADKAYKDSKLCNVLFTRELQRRLGDSGIVVNCFNPGLIVSTGLFRDQNQRLLPWSRFDLFPMSAQPPNNRHHHLLLSLPMPLDYHLCRRRKKYRTHLLLLLLQCLVSISFRAIRLFTHQAAGPHDLL